MSDKFFDVGKIGCYCESITHSTEKRKDGEQKVIVLTLKVDPFDTKLASAVSGPMRQTLFQLGNAQPHDHLRKVSFALGTPRQLLTVWATPDSPKASIALEQVRIADVYARTSKDSRGYVLVFKATFGPPSARELEFCEEWRNGMKFVDFAAAEHDDLFDLDGEADSEDDPEDEAQPRLPDPEFDTDPDGRVAETADEPVRQRLHSHAGGKKKQAKATGRAGKKSARR